MISEMYLKIVRHVLARLAEEASLFGGCPSLAAWAPQPWEMNSVILCSFLLLTFSLFIDTQKNSFHCESSFA